MPSRVVLEEASDPPPEGRELSLPRGLAGRARDPGFGALGDWTPAPAERVRGTRGAETAGRSPVKVRDG